MPALLLIYSITDNIWGTYMLFLIFLGGLLIIFIYLSALIPNEIFITQPIKIVVSFALLCLIFPMGKIRHNSARNNRELILNLFRFNFTKNYLPFILLYLLAGLFGAILLCEKSKNPLKTNTYEQTKAPTPTKNY